MKLSVTLYEPYLPCHDFIAHYLSILKCNCPFLPHFPDISFLLLPTKPKQVEEEPSSGKQR